MIIKQYRAMSETSRYLKTFMMQLGRNRMGHSFMKLVTRSLDRRTFLTSKSNPPEPQTKHSQTSKKGTARVKSQVPSEGTVLGFRVKEGSLGDSVRLMDLSPRRIESPKKPRSRHSPNSKHFSKLNSMVMDRKVTVMQDVLNRRTQWLKLNKLDYILSTLTNNPHVHTVRVYKQKLRKFYNIRYVKERLSHFFDYEYIQDYNSQIQVLKTLLALNLEEIYYLSFLALDHNGDGLICNNDLFTMATASKGENKLLNKDLYKIFQYVTYYHNLTPNMSVVDVISDEEMFRAENMTFHKYRLLELKMEREKEKSRRMAEESYRNPLSSYKRAIKTEGMKDGKVILTRKINRHLFSFRKEEEQGQEAIKELRKKFAQIQLQTKSHFSFKINFNRFKTIFAHTLPDTYFDLLYIQGGIQLPEKQYLPLSFDIEEHEHRDVAEVAVDRYNYFRGKVEYMRDTFRHSHVERLSLDSQSLRSLRR